MSMLSLWNDFYQAINNNWQMTADGGHVLLVEAMFHTMLDFPQNPGRFININKPEKQYKTVVLVSGGMDSSIAWFFTSKEHDRLALYVNLHNQYSDKEIAAIDRVGIPALIYDYPFPGDFPLWDYIIPGRNFLLLSIAESFVQHDGEIWLSAVNGETSYSKGDKSDLFFYFFETYSWRVYRKAFKIKTLKDKTKNEWLQWYLSETGNDDILDTITCMSGEGDKGCGKCHACVRKWIAMRYCNIDINRCLQLFDADPRIGGYDFFVSYRDKMQNAISTNDFSHYSQDRCIQDMTVINEVLK